MLYIAYWSCSQSYFERIFSISRRKFLFGFFLFGLGRFQQKKLKKKFQAPSNLTSFWHSLSKSDKFKNRKFLGSCVISHFFFLLIFCTTHQTHEEDKWTNEKLITAPQKTPSFEHHRSRKREKEIFWAFISRDRLEEEEEIWTRRKWQFEWWTFMKFIFLLFYIFLVVDRNGKVVQMKTKRQFVFLFCYFFFRHSSDESWSTEFELAVVKIGALWEIFMNFFGNFLTIFWVF